MATVQQRLVSQALTAPTRTTPTLYRSMSEAKQRILGQQTATVPTSRIVSGLQTILQRRTAPAGATTMVAPPPPILVSQPVGGTALTPGPSAQAVMDTEEEIAGEMQPTIAGMPPIVAIALVGAVAYMLFSGRKR